MSRIWQVAAGEPNRDYADLFTGFDVMFMGPGDHGPFEDSKYASLAAAGAILA